MFFFPRTVNNSKSPGSRPAGIMLLTQLCYVLRLQNTGQQKVLDTSAPMLKRGVYFIPRGKKKKALETLRSLCLRFPGGEDAEEGRF